MQEGASARFKRFFYLYQYVCLYVYLSVFLIRNFSYPYSYLSSVTFVCRSEKLLLIQFLFRLFPMFLSDWNIYSSVRFFFYHSTLIMIVFLLLCSFLFYLFSLLSVFSQIYFCIYVKFFLSHSLMTNIPRQYCCFIVGGGGGSAVWFDYLEVISLLNRYQISSIFQLKLPISIVSQFYLHFKKKIFQKHSLFSSKKLIIINIRK